MGAQIKTTIMRRPPQLEGDERNEEKVRARSTSRELFIASITSFIGGVFLVIGFIHGRKLKVPSRIWAYGSFAFTNSGILTTNSITCFMDVMPCMVMNIGSFGRS